MPVSPILSDRLLAAYARRRWRGFLTLCRWLGRPIIDMQTSHGGVMTLYPDDHIDRIVLEDGFYEPEIIAALRPLFAPGVAIWDVGANFGLHSIAAAVAEPELQIHSFEPNPAVFARLEAHVRRNGVRARCWPVALGEIDCTATLHINASGNPGISTLTPWPEGNYTTHTQVSVVRADTLIEQGVAPAPNLIKVDVEGTEAAVLAGFGKYLKAPALRAVVFETREDLLADPSQCPAARLLLEAGFTLSALPRSANGTHAASNFLALRPA